MLDVEYRDLAQYRHHSVRLLKAHERHQDFFAVALSASASSSSIRFAMVSYRQLMDVSVNYPQE